MDSNGRSPQSSNPVSKPKDSADDCKEFQEEAMKSSEIGFKDQCAIEKKQSLPGEATEWLEVRSNQSFQPYWQIVQHLFGFISIGCSGKENEDFW